MAVTRETLYEEVWAEPMTVVASRYDVSSNYLARVCEQLNVPHPPRGYWAQLKVGVASTRPALPPATGDHNTHWEKGGQTFTPPRPWSDPLPTPGLKRRKWARPSRHPLVENVADVFRAGRVSDCGYLRPRKYALPDVFVSEAVLDDALTLASELYLALEDRGYKVTLSAGGRADRRPDVDHRSIVPKSGYDYFDNRERWSPSRPTIAALGPLAIGLSIYEASANVEAQRVNGKWTAVTAIPATASRRSSLHDFVHHRDLPTGRLVIRAYSPYFVADWQHEWRDRPQQLLGRVKRICGDIEREAPNVVALIKAGELKAEEERLRWERERVVEAKRAEERRRIEAAETSRRELLAAIEAWGAVARLEAFFADAERRAEQLPDDRRAVVKRRLEQARAVIGEADALQRFASWQTPEEIFEALTAAARNRW